MSMKNEIKSEIAIKIVNENIAKILNKYSITQDKDESRKLKEKLDFLKSIQKELYLNKKNVISSVLKRHQKGIL